MLIIATIFLTGCIDDTKTEEDIRRMAVTRTVGDMVCETKGGYVRSTTSRGYGDRWECGIGYVSVGSVKELKLDESKLQENIKFYKRVYRVK